MPPKKPNQPSKKTEQKKKEKIIEDKTFGLKNKKGAKQQKYVETVKKQINTGNIKASKMAQMQENDKKNKKLLKEKELEELNALFKPIKQTVPKGTDPKSVLCQFFRQGQCTKGEKCKFSHDLNVGRKAEKRDLYTDARDDESDCADRTKLVCKHFLDAVESGGYGWFWMCPNGGDKCTYKHALPEGYILKKDQKNYMEEQISIEELIEKERAMLGDNTTKVTLETFLKWKERKRREKREAFENEEKEKKNAFKQGRLAGISGRQMFEFDPTIAGEDDEDADDGVFEREVDEEDEYDGPVVDLILENITATDVDASGTQATKERFKHIAEATKLDQAAALPPTSTDEQIAMAIAATENGEIASDIPIDEGLFDGDDIDLIDEDLENLEVEDD